MRKTDLKVGEEYAVFPDPGTAKKLAQGRHGATPFRVTLLAVDASEQVWQSSPYGGGSQLATRKGIKVSVPTKQEGNRLMRKTVEIRIYEKNVAEAIEAGLKILPEETDDYYSGRGLRKAEWTREFLLLQNAGCFVSTWADYEVEQAARDERAAKNAEAARQKRLAADAAAPAIQARFDAVKEKLATFGEVKQTTDWRNEPDGGYYVRIDSNLLKAERLQAYGEAEGHVISGASFALGLDTMAKLLGL